MDLRQGKCSSCEHSFRVPATFTANKVRCPKCKAVVELAPAASGAAPAAEAKRPARAGAGAARSGAARAGAARSGAARAGAARAAEGAGADDAGPRHGRARRGPPPKKSRMPWVIGGVALVGLIAAAVAFTRGGSEEAAAAAPAAAVLAKPDFSALADLEPAEGTSPDAWAQMGELMTKYTTPPFDKSAERAGDLMMHKGKPAVPAIINAYKRIDLTTPEGRDIGWKMQTLLLQGLTGGVNFGWRRGSGQEDVDFNAKVVERWFAAWNTAKLDDAAWAQMAQETAPPAAQ